MKNYEQLKKKELINLITEVRPKADCYDRVCTELGIENNIITFVKNLKTQNDTKHRELLFDFYVELRENGRLYNDSMSDIKMKSDIDLYIKQLKV
jgi:hypothetical protein